MKIKSKLRDTVEINKDATQKYFERYVNIVLKSIYRIHNNEMRVSREMDLKSRGLSTIANRISQIILKDLDY